MRTVRPAKPQLGITTAEAGCQRTRHQSAQSRACVHSAAAAACVLLPAAQRHCPDPARARQAAHPRSTSAPSLRWVPGHSPGQTEIVLPGASRDPCGQLTPSILNPDCGAGVAVSAMMMGTTFLTTAVMLVVWCAASAVSPCALALPGCLPACLPPYALAWRPGPAAASGCRLGGRCTAVCPVSCALPISTPGDRVAACAALPIVTP